MAREKKRQGKAKARKEKKTSGFLKRYLGEEIDYIIKSRNYIYFMVGLFAISIIIGFVFHGEFSFFDVIIKELVKKTENLDGLELILFIFQNNLWSAFITLISGIAVGIFPVISCVLNGSILGYVMQITWENYGVVEFWRILPHGIFELPAILISMALGLRTGMFIFSENKLNELKSRTYNSIAIFLKIILPLLIIAAIIEGTLITVSYTHLTLPTIYSV